MIKRSISRSTRAKGVKVKHIVQIILLLGVCIWLIYQVKHSRDKKKELNDDGEERLSGKMQNDLGFLKLGRKELNPRVEEVSTREKHEEEEEEEDETGGEDEERKHEEDDPQEDNKEEENREEEDVKHKEAEDEGRGGGDDEIDENDQETEENADFIDDEKEKDDGEGETETDERGDREEEEEISSEENDHDGGDEKTHEAREEHYKGDDASSAVTHDTRLINGETEETNFDSNNFEHEEKLSDSEETIAVHDRSRIMEEGMDKTTEDGNSTAFVNLDRTKADDKSPQDVIMATQLNEQHPEANDTDQVKTEAGSGSTENIVSSQTQQTEGETIYHSADAQNLTVNILTDGSTGNDLFPESTYSDSNLTISLKDENGNGSKEVSSKSSNETESAQHEETSSGSSEVDGESGVTEEGTDGVNGLENAALEDPIDTSDSGIAHEMEETRMDLDTLPEIRTEVDNSDETAAE